MSGNIGRKNEKKQTLLWNFFLCMDGDFNVGISSEEGLEKLIEKKRKSEVALTVLGYGMGNYKDNKIQILAEKGNGNHAYIDFIGSQPSIGRRIWSNPLYGGKGCKASSGV